MAKAPPAFQFYPNDFMTGTSRFTAAEVGGYILLLCEQWHTGSVPGDDVKALALILRCGQPQARTIWSHIRHKFQREESGVWLNARLEDERQRQSDYRSKQSDRGRSGARERWEKVPDSSAKGVNGNGAGHVPAIAQAKPDDSSSSSEERTKNPPKGSRREPMTLDADTRTRLSSMLSQFTAEERYSAKTFHDAVQQALEAFGCTVDREYRIADRGDGYAGKVDLVVTHPVKVALELDRVGPRQKSLDKLRVLARAGYAGVVLCRVGERFAWRQQGEIAIYAEAPPTNPKVQAEAEHIRQTQEVKRLMAQGLTFVDASRRVGFT